ncbi:hypothetical protein ATANTOWER_020719 [Ataeniobius toweri]|uniref:Secreted protein n=1 Tax=Ataeniobius toweri TaxID=208326 RepID=A0ABU7BR48_9TELE|nr:hypothetical protein [Ataeniobius toweri]
MFWIQTLTHVLLCHGAPIHVGVKHPDRSDHLTLTYLQVMLTVVVTLKHQPVKRFQEGDTMEVLHSLRLVLQGREGSRSRRGPTHLPAVDMAFKNVARWQQPGAFP